MRDSTSTSLSPHTFQVDRCNGRSSMWISGQRRATRTRTAREKRSGPIRFVFSVFLLYFVVIHSLLSPAQAFSNTLFNNIPTRRVATRPTATTKTTTISSNSNNNNHRTVLFSRRADRQSASHPIHPNDETPEHNNQDGGTSSIEAPTTTPTTRQEEDDQEEEERILRPVYYQQSTLTPYHILHPYVVPDIFEYPVEPKPLYRALSLIRQALTDMATCNPHDFTKIVRIEHPITKSSVDPLAWISKQQHRLVSHHTTATFATTQQSASQTSMFYCQNQEEDLEVAALGAVHTCRSTADVWSFLEHPHWPRASRWYGGARFDSSSSSSSSSSNHQAPPSPEWNEFGSQAWWFLPKVELRREGNQTVLAVHVVPGQVESTLDLVQRLTDETMARVPPTTLPPVLSRSTTFERSDGVIYDGQELYEEAVTQAIQAMESETVGDRERLEKVVLSRVQRMQLGVMDFCALAVLRRWKYGGNEGGHLFWMQPEGGAEFFGCAPERLFRVQKENENNHHLVVQSEALAGTRPRGSTPAEDTNLLQELLGSPKDQHENQITGDFIGRAFSDMQEKGWVTMETLLEAESGRDTLQFNGEVQQPTKRPHFFVRRLLHLQHLCQSFKATITQPDQALNVTRFIMSQLHPTPAVCGAPLHLAQEFIRKYETVGFDRGFYAGPVGYLGLDASDVFVALRSALLTRDRDDTRSSLLVYAGAGVVPGSTVKGEWAETNYKLSVISSVFPQSPMTLQGAQTPNVAWGAAFLEELIRNGVTQFYVCPGSRSTPLVVALSRAARSHVGVVHLTSVHDERAAAFRAVGYARGAQRPAAVVTSSGTAVANLYPAVVEAGMDGVPLLLLTADRPYENRDTGANQAIDQVKMFDAKYVRWFRDILPPSDEVPISLALSDAGHAVSVSKRARGPVHLNIQFRENLAPDNGAIRNDKRSDAVTRFNGFHFTSTPKFKRWSIGGGTFTKELVSFSHNENTDAVVELSRLISNSKRGLIIVGNVRPSLVDNDSHVAVADAISDFAEHIGFPILAGAQQVSLRFRSSSVVLFAEHILKSPTICSNLKPDLVIQIGAPLISTEISSIISKSIQGSVQQTSHVLIHPLASSERIDPSFTVTHQISADYSIFLKRVAKDLVNSRGSSLTSLITLGRRLQGQMKQIIQHACHQIAKEDSRGGMGEPEVILGMAESFGAVPHQGLFLSNSMPIRDTEFFFYPFSNSGKDIAATTGSNRGASGIDGIVSSALGFAEATELPTTLVVGDVSTLHDIGSFHNLVEQTRSTGHGTGKRHHPLTTVVVNNDGGGIFSFLPIARHGKDVSFNEFFGTPTNSFSFEKGAEAFGLPYSTVVDYEALTQALSLYPNSSSTSRLLEIPVISRDSNVRAHRKISADVIDFIEDLLTQDESDFDRTQHSVKTFSNDFQNSTEIDDTKTLVLLHGWMGEKGDWDEVALSLSGLLSPSWSIKAIDMTGHGESSEPDDPELEYVRRSFNLPTKSKTRPLSVNRIADSVTSSLRQHGVTRIDGIVGYSLGGRVAVAMSDLYYGGRTGLIHNGTKLVLVSSFAQKYEAEASTEDQERMAKDDALSEKIISRFSKLLMKQDRTLQKLLLWDEFLDNWYSTPMWGGIKSNVNYPKMKQIRSKSLGSRGLEIADVLAACSPPRNKRKLQIPKEDIQTLVIVGEEDKKYLKFGQLWCEEYGAEFCSVKGAGHALVLETPGLVAEGIADFISRSDQSSDARMSAHVPSKNKQTFDKKLSEQSLPGAEMVISLRYRPFSLAMNDGSPGKSVSGIGWGKEAQRSQFSSRSGIILQLEMIHGDDVAVGIGEISPLAGLHTETLELASNQIQEMREKLEKTLFEHGFDAEKMLQLTGYARSWLESTFPDTKLLPSVRAGLEMALLGLAAHKLKIPIHRAILRKATTSQGNGKCVVRVNGLMTRGSQPQGILDSQSFESLKVKVGHQDLEEDISSLREALNTVDLAVDGGKIRLDANCAWKDSEARIFSEKLRTLGIQDRIEFIEEPLSNQATNEKTWNLATHVASLEQWFAYSGLPYALDETLADLAVAKNFEFDMIERDLLKVFESDPKGCSAFVLKPAFLGPELSMQLARLAQQTLKIGAIFTSSFDSGVGLAHTAFVAAASAANQIPGTEFAHGLGTFVFFEGDILSPTFSSYMSKNGQLNVASLSRAFSGLTIDELAHESDSQAITDDVSIETSEGIEEELSTVVTLPLPFPADIAHSRFTDLPQQPRWSPWLSSVSYRGKESEWKINIRGMNLMWRAESELIERPWLGIQWKSVSGVSNHGSVEFIPTGAETCDIKVTISITPPRILAPLFRKAKSSFLEEFIRDKIINWSLEMFRDVVKADLAIERGDVELGDALYGVVEGKANAIEATLKRSE